MDRFHLDPARFPAQTKDLFTVDIILQYGALPLGYKAEAGFFRRGKYLNVGLLDPDNVGKSIAQVARQAGAAFAGVNLFRLDPAEFVRVLDEVYRVPDAAIRTRRPGVVDATLRRFLETPAESSPS